MKGILATLRILIGFEFLWAFMDKLLGLGFATEPQAAWIAGGSPTEGFLKFASRGPLAGLYQAIGGSAVVDWLFMLGLLFVGLTLILGVLVKISTTVGAVMMVLLWSAVLPPNNNPLIDAHIINVFLLILLNISGAGRYFGLGKWWSKTGMVKRVSVLE
ncbi:MAG: hypothetical protein PHN32_01435 [Actinomycetota bacterium]|nr:hypothetical protein [Actinomycetota bacterium]